MLIDLANFYNVEQILINLSLEYKIVLFQFNTNNY